MDEFSGNFNEIVEQQQIVLGNFFLAVIIITLSVMAIAYFAKSRRLMKYSVITGGLMTAVLIVFLALTSAGKFAF